MGKSIRDAMTSNPRGVEPSTSVVEAARLMKSQDVGPLPVVEGDRLVVGTMMTATLTADHRAVDGATAAEFMRTLKGLLEEPASMLL